MKAVSNPPNPWLSTRVEYLDEEPPDARLEIFEETAKSILSENDSPDLGFRYSVNPYRGCFHACAYCLDGATPILMANGTQKPIREVVVGDEIIGTVVQGRYRRYTRTSVLAHWSTVKRAFRVTLEDGTTIVSSGDHRFLTERGWKHVADHEGPVRRAHLTTNNSLLGFGALPAAPDETDAYRTGYLCGIIRGDGLLRSYDRGGRRRAIDVQHQFRLALADLEALRRARRYLDEMVIPTFEVDFKVAAGYAPMRAIRTSARELVDRIREIVVWPDAPSEEWTRGFLAGIFDAEGTRTPGAGLRITNGDPEIVEQIRSGITRLGFDAVVEDLDREPPMFNVRLRGGLVAQLRFLHGIGSAISRKRDVVGIAIKCQARLRVRSIEPLAVDRPMFDITTGTGDFIANGVVAHNCYARPSHQYLGYGAGTDFDRKIVAKVNAPELLRAAFDKRSWQGDVLMFSGITDCYQPIEASYELTRRCLEVCAEYRNPVAVITKSKVIRRDLDLLGRLAREARATVSISIPFASDEHARLIEPYTSPPTRRFETLKMLADVGVTTCVAIAPVIPGLNDTEIAEILERAHEAGARHSFMTLLRLPAEVLPVFRERIRETLAPERVRKIEHAIVELRGGTGKMNEASFGARFRGVGERWKAIEAMYELHRKRLGYRDGERDWQEEAPTFRRPGGPQLTLF